VNKQTKKYSYSKLNTYNSCGWQYYLTYEEGHYIFSESVANEVGNLVHWTEETIARTILNGQKPDYDKLKNDFRNIHIERGFGQRTAINGTNLLKEKYKEEFFEPDKNGSSYASRCEDYLSYGIYRLEKYLDANPNLEIYGMEKYFSLEFGDGVLSGYIDRIFYDKEANIYYIEDIKTKNKPFKDTELVTPLQFVVYVKALSQNLGLGFEHFKCAYDLPFLDMKQEAGTKGYMDRGIKKMNDIFASISAKDFEPNPSPLCAWCTYSPTNPNQPEAAKLLCPYYSKWTETNRVHKVAHKWEGMEKHAEIMEKEIAEQKRREIVESEDFEF